MSDQSFDERDFFANVPISVSVVVPGSEMFPLGTGFVWGSGGLRLATGINFSSIPTDWLRSLKHYA